MSARTRSRRREERQAILKGDQGWVSPGSHGRVGHRLGTHRSGSISLFDDVDISTVPVAEGDSLLYDVDREVWAPGAPSLGGPRGPYISGIMNGTRTFVFMDFLETGASSTVMMPQAFGTGSSTQVPVPGGEISHPGIINCDTGTTATGRLTWQPGQNNSNLLAVPGDGLHRFGCWIKITTLSDATNRYTFLMGFSSTPTVITVDTGAVIFYSDNVNSGKWQAITDNDNAGDQTLDLGIAVAAATWYFLEVEINAAGTQAEFFINHVSKGTISTNVPTGVGDEMVPFLGMIKSVGLTARDYNLDALYFLQEFTTVR